jgi:hypothetical protein
VSKAEYHLAMSETTPQHAKNPPRLPLEILPDRYAICRLDRDQPVPENLLGMRFVAIARTDDELSIVCPEPAAPAGARIETGWRCLRVHGNLPFEATGILASLAAPLARAGIPIFAVATFDTDYVLVKVDHFERTIAALEEAGHRVR